MNKEHAGWLPCGCEWRDDGWRMLCPGHDPLGDVDDRLRMVIGDELWLHFGYDLDTEDRRALAARIFERMEAAVDSRPPAPAPRPWSEVAPPGAMDAPDNRCLKPVAAYQCQLPADHDVTCWPGLHAEDPEGTS